MTHTFMMEEQRIGRLGSTEIVRWASRGLPPGLDALILPEDTYLLLQTVAGELDPKATPLDLWAALERAARAEKCPLGSVIIEDGKPRGVTYVARVIVYDFDREPICRTEDVRTGLRSALSELVERGCETIGVLPLGTMRGGISHEEYLDALNEGVAGLAQWSPRTLYLLGQDSAPEADVDASEMARNRQEGRDDATRDQTARRQAGDPEAQG